MQITDDNPHSMDEKVPQDTIPALEFSDDSDVVEEVKVEPKEQVQPIIDKKQSRKNIQREKRKFLGREKDERMKPEEHEEPRQDVILDDIVSTYDGKLQLQWMQEDLESMRSRIRYCESPPISDYPEENMRIDNVVEEYKKNGVFRDASKIKDYIESLMWYGKMNRNLFGSANYLLNETIDGYKKIYDDLMKLKDAGEGDEALRLLAKLILVGSRPMVIDKTLMKETEYEPSISEGGVMSGTFEPEGDMLM